MKRKKYGNEMHSRILVVDSDLTSALTVSAILKEHGYEVATTFSGEEAVAKAPDFAPDLLVTDVCMGAMDGVEAASMITAKMPECGVLFLSGLASISDVLNVAPKRLVYSFTSKPLRSLDLLNAIAYMLPAARNVDAAAAVAENDITPQHVIGSMPAKAGFILREAETRGPGATQGKPRVVFLDMGQSNKAGHQFQVQ